jgi:Zn-dependent protease
MLAWPFDVSFAQVGFEVPPLPIILAIGIVIFLAIGFHEYAHAITADMAGDPTPRLYGRVTLNLTNHFEPLGTIMIILTSLTGFGIGWGKPVPVNPNQMRNPRWDHFWSVAAGPLSNIMQAILWALVLRGAILGGMIDTMPQFLWALLFYGVLINLTLAFFNLIPLGPLDGHWLVGAFLPEPTRTRWYMFNRQIGGFLLLGLILIGQVTGTGIIRAILLPPVDFMFHFLTGVPLR